MALDYGADGGGVGVVLLAVEDPGAFENFPVERRQKEHGARVPPLQVGAQQVEHAHLGVGR